MNRKTFLKKFAKFFEINEIVKESVLVDKNRKKFMEPGQKIEIRIEKTPRQIGSAVTIRIVEVFNHEFGSHLVKVYGYETAAGFYSYVSAYQPYERKGPRMKPLEKNRYERLELEELARGVSGPCRGGEILIKTIKGVPLVEAKEIIERVLPHIEWVKDGRRGKF